MSVRHPVLMLSIAAFVLIGVSAGIADDAEQAAAVTEEGGKHFDADGYPTFNIQDDGTVDWYTFSGYRRYHSDCHVCHGPDGEGSTYAPPLVQSMANIDYPTFLSIVAEGRKRTVAGSPSVMPAFGDNKNVYCYLDDLYIYLRARAFGELPRGRPAKRVDKPQQAAEHEESCMSG
jgi:methanol metabolism-related c-type cytochrome